MESDRAHCSSAHICVARRGCAPTRRHPVANGFKWKNGMPLNVCMFEKPVAGSLATNRRYACRSTSFLSLSGRSCRMNCLRDSACL